MGVCDETNQFTCGRCGSDRAGYFCDGCSKVVCSCEDCPNCVPPALPVSYGLEMAQLDREANDPLSEEDRLWEGYPC